MGWVEKQNENQEEQKFEKEFNKELKNWWEDFDKKAFWDVISWAKFDDSLSKEENFKNAFDTKIDTMLQSNLKNIPDERKQELKNLQKDANNGKDIKSLLKSYNEIKDLFSTRVAESKKSESDIQRENGQKEDQKRQEKSQDFLEELKKSIVENGQKEDQKRQEMKTMLAENQEKMNQERAWAEWVLDWFPESESQT